MNFAYFSKFSDFTSFDELKIKIEKQKINRVMPLPYIIIKKIHISSVEFDNILLSNSNAPYASYIDLSIPTQHGVWNCIQINCIEDSRNILIYTAGTSHPLYISIADL